MERLGIVARVLFAAFGRQISEPLGHCLSFHAYLPDAGPADSVCEKLLSDQ